ncbi:MAG: hypothetical protein WAM14_21805 [Candidatus Nitrosopolaris sp.]
MLKLVYIVPLIIVLVGGQLAHARNAFDPDSYQAGYRYGTNDWNKYGPGSIWDQQHPGPVGHHFECPLSQPYWHSNFCKGYDAALMYQNSDQ